MRPIDVEAEQMLRSFVMTKEAAVLREGAPTDLSPMLDVRFSSGVRPIVVPVDAAELHALAFRFAREQGVRHMATLIDSYMLDEPTDEEKLRGPGVAAEAFARADARAFEALSCSVIDFRTGAVSTAVARYAYDGPGAALAFQPIRIVEDGGSGALPDLLRTARMEASLC